MKLIELSKTSPKRKGQYFAQVDDADYEWLNQWMWNVHFDKNNTYATRTERRSDGKRITINMHRFIMGVSDPKLRVDHQDRVGLNCQRYNLRICTQSQNCMNRRKVKDGKFKGVHQRSENSWRAVIRVNKKLIQLGNFNNEEQAAEAYDLAAVKYFKEFACLNFPDRVKEVTPFSPNEATL